MSIHYISTRGSAAAMNFEEVVLAGLADDGGLYVPDQIPPLSMGEIANMHSLTYPELAFTIISRFIDSSIELDALERIITGAYRQFRHSAIAPIKQLDAHTFLLELFHGPTLAFKDFALQILGRLLDHILSKRGQRATIIGATSGDTGSAAIAGCRGRSHMDIFILHPLGRVSEVQRRQMTTASDGNVFNIAIEGNFDDCQDIVKTLFNDSEFKLQHQLTAVNSINWARIVAQVVYYFYAALALGAPSRSVSFAVPTGNFGDIYAGYIARQMGLPIEQLIIATNHNDILSRCLESGIYGMQEVMPSLSPSMDIQVSSNFERLLFDLYSQEGTEINAMMQRFRAEQSLALSPLAWNRLKAEFSACSVSEEETLHTIASTWHATGELLDPHTAVGLSAGQRCRKDNTVPLVALATAHPAKFPDAVQRATGITPALPDYLQDIFTREERYDILPNDAGQVKAYINEMI